MQIMKLASCEFLVFDLNLLLVFIFENEMILNLNQFLSICVCRKQS